MRWRDVLLWMILNDLPVEPGARTAYTIEIPAASYSTTRDRHYRLVVD